MRWDNNDPPHNHASDQIKMSGATHIKCWVIKNVVWHDAMYRKVMCDKKKKMD